MAKLNTPVGAADHITGKTSATVTVVEYGDYLNFHCAEAHSLIKRLMKEYNHEFLFVFRNFPDEENAEALIAALAAEAAGLQNKFWEMHELIFEQPEQLTEDNLIYFAETLNLDVKQFEMDRTSQNVLSKVESDIESGIRSDVQNTPTFYINDERIESYDETYESLANAIKNAQ